MTRFEAFVAPARGNPALWRTVLGTAGAVLVWLGSAALLIAAAGRIAAGDPRFILLAYLGSFAFLTLGVAMATRLLQRRSFATLFGPGGFRPRHFSLAILAVVILGGISAAATIAWTGPERRLGLGDWAAWLPLALPLLLVQSAAEELLFRGFLMQSLAARFRARAIWLLLPAAVFGLMHWSPGDGADPVLTIAGTALIGLVLADITCRTGNLSAAIGLHFANNCFALTLVSAQPELSAFSLYVVPPGPVRDFLPVADLATTLLAYVLWLRLWGRGTAT